MLATKTLQENDCPPNTIWCRTDDLHYTNKNYLNVAINRFQKTCIVYLELVVDLWRQEVTLGPFSFLFSKNESLSYGIIKQRKLLLVTDKELLNCNLTLFTVVIGSSFRTMKS